MPVDIDLNALPLSELEQLKKDVEKAISTVEQRRKRDALSAVRSAAKEFGFSLDELLPENGATKTSSKAKLPAKYRNPEDPAQTWSGRGRRPAWFEAALERGKTPEDLEIKQAA